MYSNGRIYVDTSVTPNVGVSIGDLQQCFQTVIKATIGGETVRRLSSDLGVIIAKTTEDGHDSISDGGVTWRVESRQDINPWARYRPIPLNTVPDTPEPITDSERMTEQFGFDMPIDLYKPAEEAGYNDYVSKVIKYGDYWMPLRPFPDYRWKRLTDFVKTNDNGTAVHNKGYDHNAKPDNVKVTVKVSSSDAPQCNGTHFLEPLVAENEKYIVIPPGSTSAGRYPFPNDHLWMDYYYKKEHGELTYGDEVTVARTSDEWLSPIDLMGRPDYITGYTSVRRRLALYRMRNGNDQWTDNEADFHHWCIWCIITDTTTGTGEGLRSRPFELYPDSWVDFTDAAQPSNVRYIISIPGVTIGNVTGKMLAVECWLGAKSSQNIMPIPGFAYELNIDRTNIEITVDIADKLIYWFVLMTDETISGTGTTVYDYVLEIYYSPSGLGLSKVIETNAEAIAALSALYESLTVTIGATTVNLLQNSANIEYADGGADSHHLNYRRLECTFVRQSLDNMRGQTVTVSGKRVNTGSIPAQIKQIVVLTDENDIIST